MHVGFNINDRNPKGDALQILLSGQVALPITRQPLNKWFQFVITEGDADPDLSATCQGSCKYFTQQESILGHHGSSHVETARLTVQPLFLRLIFARRARISQPAGPTSLLRNLTDFFSVLKS